jgi:hypothetical protein
VVKERRLENIAAYGTDRPSVALRNYYMTLNVRFINNVGTPITIFSKLTHSQRLVISEQISLWADLMVQSTARSRSGAETYWPRL